MLKEVEFSKSGNNYCKPMEGLFHCIGVQSSRNSEPGARRLTVNLGVYVCEIHTLMDWEYKAKCPNAAHCVISERIGRVMPGSRDQWWTIEAESACGEVAESLHTAIENFALPFLEQFLTVHDCYEWILLNESPFRRAHVHLLQGDLDAARACRKSLRQSANARYVVPRLDRASRKLNLKL